MRRTLNVLKRKTEVTGLEELFSVKTPRKEFFIFTFFFYSELSTWMSNVQKIENMGLNQFVNEINKRYHQT